MNRMLNISRYNDVISKQKFLLSRSFFSCERQFKKKKKKKRKRENGKKYLLKWWKDGKNLSIIQLMAIM